MSKISKFIKSSGIYFVGNVLTKVISFLLLPLYTNYITTEGMGYFDLANSYMNIIVPIICVTIWSGILRFVYDYNDQRGKYKVIFNAMIVFAFATGVFTIGSIVLGLNYNIKDMSLIYIMGLSMMLQNCYSNITRGLGYNATFALSGIIGGLVNCVSNIIMILCFGMGEESLFIALTIGLFTQVVIMEAKVKFLHNVSLKMFDKKLLGSMLKYCVPVAVNSACYWFLSSYNRISISNILGLEANGIYSIAGKYTYVIGLVSTCFSLAMQELLYSMGNEKEGKSEFYNRTANYYVKFLMFGLILLMPMVVVSFPILIGNNYSAAFNLIPLYLFATVGSIFAGFLGDIFAAEKNTNILFYTTIISSVVNVVLFHVLVNSLGTQAANISLSVAYIVMIIMRLLFLKKSFTIKLNYSMIIFTSLLFIVSWFVYLRCGIIGNIIAFIAYFLITIFVFMDLIKQLLSIVKAKIQR